MQSETRNQLVIDYFEKCISQYDSALNLVKNRQLNYGYWDDQTKTLQESFQRKNEVMAEFVGIQPTDHVLDAGCGVGGSAIFLAKKYGCSVTGISINSLHISRAEQYAQAERLNPMPQFLVADFTNTPFQSETFDVIWAIESVCYAEEKKDFIQEAFRLLKRGGKLILQEGFVTETRFLTLPLGKKVLDGWAIPTVDTQFNFKEKLIKAGFSSIIYNNTTQNILPTSKYLYLKCILMLPIAKLSEWLGFGCKDQIANIRATMALHRGFQKGLVEYGMFYAEKAYEGVL